MVELLTAFELSGFKFKETEAHVIHIFRIRL